MCLMTPARTATEVQGEEVLLERLFDRDPRERSVPGEIRRRLPELLQRPLKDTQTALKQRKSFEG